MADRETKQQIQRTQKTKQGRKDMDDFSKLPESFRKANDATDSEMSRMENLLIAFRFAALWDREHPSLEGPAWSYFFEETLAERALALAVRASELKEVSARIATAEDGEKIRGAGLVVVKEVSKLQDLLNLLDAAGINLDEKGPDENVNFATAFEILLDSIARIREACNKAWEVVTAPYKQAGAQKENSGGIIEQ
jgi:hypothetical protein